MPNCRQCGAALSAMSFGEVSDYRADCGKQVAPASKQSLIDDLPQISTLLTAGSMRRVCSLRSTAPCSSVMTASGASPLLPDTDQLIRCGADYGPYTLDGQPWRMITSSFLHVGILHLAVNMWSVAAGQNVGETRRRGDCLLCEYQQSKPP